MSDTILSTHNTQAKEKVSIHGLKSLVSLNKSCRLNDSTNYTHLCFFLLLFIFT